MELAMTNLEATLLKFRVEDEGRPSWLGTEQRLVKKEYNADDSDPDDKEDDEDENE
ncbi:hypothetical protein QFC21_002595 [Naganishia friedmannii]|uniref:Uncharacterized protein n=1 Tax=Naganishia friedmannii TaxID=89922 RepID=A0ACC2VVL5_9TREE|nr:hypothetical protein QFC21_002595 [Naganishia friedmannii]